MADDSRRRSRRRRPGDAVARDGRACGRAHCRWHGARGRVDADGGVGGTRCVDGRRRLCGRADQARRGTRRRHGHRCQYPIRPRGRVGGKRARREHRAEGNLPRRAQSGAVQRRRHGAAHHLRVRDRPAVGAGRAAGADRPSGLHPRRPAVDVHARRHHRRAIPGPPGRASDATFRT
ncbi:hypothetical protein SDC9_115126 [bioreactor metagenome]|uniref:Uncharacterized protein n=1 Tax=bioreactor metagenome TaxID=1076179 RepID=A0A645BS90_9ZZZZ